jgi:membrane dipeptidase
MKVFDLHCDTIGECYKQGKSLLTNDMHFSLDRARFYDEYNQVFAIWITDDLRGKAAVDSFDKVADLYYNTLQEHSDVISEYSSKSDTPVNQFLP